MKERELSIIIGGGKSGLQLAEQFITNNQDFLLFEMSPFIDGKPKRQHQRYSADERFQTNTIVHGITKDLELLIEQEETTATIQASNVYVATGSYEEPLVFSGWTLPGIITSQAANQLFYRDRVPLGKRVVYLSACKVDEKFFVDMIREYIHIDLLEGYKISELTCIQSSNATLTVSYTCNGKRHELKDIDLVICQNRRLPALELVKMAGAKVEKTTDDMIRPVLNEQGESSIQGLFVVGSAAGRSVANS
ncbi:hypothetical protein LC040_02000 [Bacillus tianshenii]|nr:hypothetical protein LC040_02000 [Bacillus tianshenii]